jgi:O-antigen ligase
MMIDRQRLAQIADWEAVAVAASLPWSTSATSILLVVWLITLLPTLDVSALRREATIPAGGLPVLLWILGAAGMLWANVSWTERLGGLDGFHRLLVIPLLLAQFRRSENGGRALYAFLAATTLLLLASWVWALDPPLWSPPLRIIGVPVKDVISQSTVFLICAFALVGYACDLLRNRNFRNAFLAAGLAALFLGNLAYVAVSRADVVVAPILVLLLGWRQLRWKGAMIACVAGAVLTTGAWLASPNLGPHFFRTLYDVRDYLDSGADNDVGDHIEFLRKSMQFVREAPIIGHGTGSIADQFRRSTIGKSGAAAVATVNPHSQIFAVALQLGLLGTAVLLAMWGAHYVLFRSGGLTAWIGTLVVVENFISSLTSSHLFDFTHGWLYVVGVGVAGGMVLNRADIASCEDRLDSA